MTSHDQPPEGLRPSLVVLTTGDRPQPLTEALVSVEAQSGVSWADLVVVWNGGTPPDQSLQRTDVILPDNVGIPEGRNIGVARSSGDVLVFLDDDARFTNDQSIATAMDMFAAAPTLGAISFRVADETGATSRRHVPRLGGKRATVRGEVSQFLGGAVAIRRAAFDDAGGYAGDFFYAMEESDLALGMIDAGWTIRYEPSIEVFHPRTVPARHAHYIQRTARNRVLLARRRLPWIVGVIYVLNWLAITTVRERAGLSALKALAAGTREGLTDSADRKPIRWRTVWTLTQLGRPPII